MSTAVPFTLSLALLIGGIYLFGAAFSAPAGQAFVFIGGLLCVTLAWMIPLLILPSLGSGSRRSNGR